MDKRLGDVLRLKQLRVTNARQVIFSILADSEKAMSAQDVFKSIKGHSRLRTDQASVYRNLTLFAELGLVHRLQDGRYSICKHDQESHHNHVHIIANCTQCGNTYEVSNHSRELCQLTRKMQTYVESFGHFSGLTLQGICRECRK